MNNNNNNGICIGCGNNTQRIEKDHEIICTTCGAVLETIECAESIPSQTQTKITSHDQNKIGSKNIVDPKLKLEHINKKKTASILEKNDAYTTEFFRCCDILNLHHAVTQTAFSMFCKLRPHKLGIGKTVVFCISHSCDIFEIVHNINKIIETVRWRFGLKRMFSVSDVIYSVKPTALELGVISPSETPSSSESESFAIRKHVEPKRHIPASKMLDWFPGNSQKKAKIVQKFLEAY